MIENYSGGDHQNNGRSFRYRPDGTPIFRTPQDWLNHYHDFVSKGFRPWAPATLEELLLADAEGLLSICPQWIPCAAQLRFWGLSPKFGRDHQPYGELGKERLLATIARDNQLKAALRSLLLGGR